MKRKRDESSTLTSLLNDLPYMALVLDNTSQIILWNKKCVEVCGYTEEEMQQISPLFETIIPNLEHRDILQAYITQGTSSTESFEVELRCSDDSRKCADFSVKALPDGYFGNGCILITGNDVTESKRTERKLTRRLRYEEGLTSASRVLLKNGEKALANALEILVRAAKASRVYLFKNFENGKGDMYARCVHHIVNKKRVEPGTPNLCSEIPYKAYLSRWKKMMEKGESVQGRALDFPESEQEFLNKFSIKALCIIPIYIKNSWYGFLGFDDTESPKPWSEEDFWILRTEAEMISSYIEKKTFLDDLKESEKRFFDIATTTQGIVSQITTTPEGTLETLFISDGVKKILGYNPKEFYQGISFPSLIKSEEEKKKIAYYFQKSKEDLQPFSLSYPIMDKSGNEKFLHTTNSVQKLENGKIIWNSVSIDITDMIQTREALKRSEARARVLLNSPAYAIVLIDDSGQILDINETALSLLGKTKRDWIGTNVYDLFSKDFSDPRREEMKKLFRTGQSAHFEDQFNSRYYDVGAYPIIETDEGPLLAALFVQDITDKKTAEEQAKINQQQLIQADKLASLGTLVAGVVHEINNPNQSIMLNGTLIKEVFISIQPILEKYFNENGDFSIGGLHYSEMRGKMRTYLDAVLNGANRIENIISELKTFARKDETTDHMKININMVVRAAITLTKNLINKSTHNLKIELNDVPTIMGNFQRLEQVFINIIQNACQALRSMEEEISISTLYDGKTNNVVIRFADQGIGIEKPAIKEVTNPFYSTKRQKGGTGLGLSVSLSIIKEHKGEIIFSSEVNKGTTVDVLLPAEKEEALKNE